MTARRPESSAKKLDVPLYFAGFNGTIDAVSSTSSNVCYVLDANVVLNLLSQKRPDSIQQFLDASSVVVRREWEAAQPKLAIDPFLAIMELTKQLVRPDIRAFLKMFSDLVNEVYGIGNYHPAWAMSTYATGVVAQAKVFPSTVATVEKMYSLIDWSDKPDDEVILSACEAMYIWLLTNHQKLAFIGGPLLYAITYALAGSPDARNLLKCKMARQGKSKEAAKNVAWDFSYWLRIDMEYHRNVLSDCVFCTADRSFGQLLSRRAYRGPRLGLTSKSEPQSVPADGIITPFKFKRLESTKLESKVGSMFMGFLGALNELETDSFKYGVEDLLRGGGNAA